MAYYYLHPIYSVIFILLAIILFERGFALLDKGFRTENFDESANVNAGGYVLLSAILMCSGLVLGFFVFGLLPWQ